MAQMANKLVKAVRRRPSADQTADSPIALSLLAAYPGPVVVADRDGRPLAANAAGAEVADLLRNPNATEIHKVAASVLNRGQGTDCLLTLGIGQKTRKCNLTFVPLLDAGGTNGFIVLGRDVTLQENLRQVLVESRSRFKDLVECSADFVWETDKAGRFVYVTPRGALGYAAAQLVGQPATDFLAEGLDEAQPFPFQCTERIESVEIQMIRADGETAIVRISCTPIRNEFDGVVGARGVARDVTEVRRRDEALARALGRERLLARIVQTIRDEVEPQTLLQTAAQAAADGLSCSWSGLYRAEEGGALVRVAEFAREMARIDHAEVDAAVGRFALDGAKRPLPVGRHMLMFEPTRYREKLNGVLCVARSWDDHLFTGEDNELLAGVANQLGIAIEQISTHEQLLELSRTDGLTGLLNRRAFVDEVRARLANAERSKRCAALFYVDMNNLKALNDVQGHKDGDRALTTAADILRRHVRIKDPVARIGGDEFAIWYDNMTAQVAEEKAERVWKASHALAALSADPARPLGLAVGVALFDPATPETLNELFERADETMYTAKRHSKEGRPGYALSLSQSAKTETAEA